jgi:CDP-diacylglycerol---glycerol-3-phosphate 3-phosphatidyltransferase
MALNAYARAIVNRISEPVGRGLARAGFSANGLTVAGVVLTAGGAATLLAGQRLGGILLLVLGALTDLLDGAVARARATASRFGAFFDSVSDRVSDAILLGTAAWMVRESPQLFTVAMVALAGAQVTSYIRAKAESLGWNATVGVLERAERIIILIVAFAFDVLAVALWVLAAGALVTIVQRLRVVVRQARQEVRTDVGGGGQEPTA